MSFIYSNTHELVSLLTLFQVAAMTDPAYKGLVIIIAGYAKEIDDMLNKNPGLKSRFSRSVVFEDWNSQDRWQFLSKLCEKENYHLHENMSGLVIDKIDKVRMEQLTAAFQHRKPRVKVRNCIWVHTGR